MKLKKEFASFYQEIRIDSESHVLKDKREVLEDDIKSNLPDILSEHGISVSKSNIRMIDQGSYKYNTTIKDDVVDRDVAVIIPLSTSDNSDPRKIKKYLKEAIDIPSRSVAIKEPCVRASYHEDGKEWLHIDLPLYAEDGSLTYLARGKATSDTYSWEIADPDGLNNYMCGNINGNGQLRRIICYIKKWRNIKYENAANDHEVPPSIGLTLLAIDCFSAQTSSEGDDDLLAFQKTLLAIRDRFSIIYDKEWKQHRDIACTLPVAPYTDVFAKMRESSVTYIDTFYNRISTAVDNLTNALNVESEHDAAEYVQKVLGNDFTVPPKEAVATAAYNRREHSFG